jgi:hypothetical protein
MLDITKVLRLITTIESSPGTGFLAVLLILVNNSSSIAAIRTSQVEDCFFCSVADTHWFQCGSGLMTKNLKKNLQLKKIGLQGGGEGPWGRCPQDISSGTHQGKVTHNIRHYCRQMNFH